MVESSPDLFIILHVIEEPRNGNYEAVVLDNVTSPVSRSTEELRCFCLRSLRYIARASLCLHG